MPTPPLPPPLDPAVTTAVRPGEDAVALCLADLRAAGIEATSATDHQPAGECAIETPVRIESVSGPAGRVELPARPLLDCGFALTFADWISGIVSPVAAQVLASPLAAVETGPGYVCRGMNGVTDAKRSAHAIGNAIDIVGFRLADRRRLLIEGEPRSTGADKAFLMAMRTSACGYFLTVLGPGSDDAHSDHLHVDLAQPGRSANHRICE